MFRPFTRSTLVALPRLARLRDRHQGYTLMEILVASMIFVFLGVALVTFLRQGVSLWKTAETRGRIYERARAVLDTVAADLRATVTDVDSAGDRFWLRFICDEDAHGRQRLRFVRTLADEMSDSIARHGGDYLVGDDSRYHDQHDDPAEIEAGLLLPGGGFQEIIYAMDPEPDREILWRGIRSPIGGAGTLFSSRNIELDPRELARRAREARQENGGPELSAEGPKTVLEHPLTRVARPLVGDILHLGFRFWTPTTNTWNAEHPPLERPSPGRPSGPTAYWDSTRALLDEKGSSSRDFRWRAREGSLSDPDDDVFPERVEVTVTIRGNPEMPRNELTRELSPKDAVVYLLTTAGLPESGPFRYIRVGEEWIRYEAVEGDRLNVAPDGRGARGTVASKHPAASPVETGTSFRRVVEIPSYRQAVEASELERTRGRRSFHR